MGAGLASNPNASQPGPGPILDSRHGWGRLAEFYHELRSEGGRFHKNDPARIAEATWMQALLSEIELKGRRVLDVGCGFGYYGMFAAERGAEVTAVDFATEMLEIGRRVANERGVRLELRQADVCDLSPFPDHSFDVVVSGMDLETPDIRRAFQECARVLVPRGVFLLSVPHPIIHHGTWHRDPEGEKLFFALDGYFERGPFVAEWRDEAGELVRFERYRRPLQDYTEALASAGFVIQRLLEGEPAKEGQDTETELYRDLHRVPSYLIIQAIKAA